MKSISLSAATALLAAASSVQARLLMGFADDLSCSNLDFALDLTAWTAGSPSQAQCFGLGEYAGSHRSLVLWACDGHSQCQCELHGDSGCGAGLSVTISFLSNLSGPQFCYTGGAEVAAVRCWYN